MGHFLCCVERVKRFVTVDLHYIVNDLKMIRPELVAVWNPGKDIVCRIFKNVSTDLGVFFQYLRSQTGAQYSPME